MARTAQRRSSPYLPQGLQALALCLPGWTMEPTVLAVRAIWSRLEVGNAPQAAPLASRRFQVCRMPRRGVVWHRGRHYTRRHRLAMLLFVF